MSNSLYNEIYDKNKEFHEAIKELKLEVKRLREDLDRIKDYLQIPLDKRRKRAYLDRAS